MIGGLLINRIFGPKLAIAKMLRVGLVLEVIFYFNRILRSTAPRLGTYDSVLYSNGRSLSLLSCGLS